MLEVRRQRRRQCGGGVGMAGRREDREPEVERASCSATVLHPVVKCVSFLNFGCAVHPQKPLQLAHSEFIELPHSGHRIRVLHLRPGEINPNHINLTRATNIRNSFTEEYWFTRWNKPLQTPHRCSCSFRRSKIFKGAQNDLHCAPPATLIRNVETFIERLIQESLKEAMQTYLMSHKTEKGLAYDNPGYVGAPEEVGDRVCPHIQRRNEKPLVLLLHGIGNTADVWWNVIHALLRRGYEVLAPDMLGHGYSSAPNKRKAYQFARLLQHSLAVFDNYAIRNDARTFIVIGHSFGCSLATGIARYRSQQVVQLILISGGGPTALAPPSIGNEIPVFSSLQLLISPLLFCGIKRSLFYATRGKHFKACNTDDSIPKYVLKYIGEGQNWPEGDTAFHRRILIPTLLVHGLKDTEVTLVQECEMERTIPRAFLELIPNAGHLSLLETPEQLSHMILCFMEWWMR